MRASTRLASLFAAGALIAVLAGCASMNTGIVPETLPFEQGAAGAEIDGRRVCGEGCRKPARWEGDIWCNESDACAGSGGDCSCALFSRDPDSSPLRPESWTFEADTGDEIENNRLRRYRCFCARVKGLFD